MTLLTADLDYALPPELVAQEPPAERDAARMLVVDPPAGSLVHAMVRELPALLPARSLVVVNDTRVIPARLIGRRPSGGRVELLLVEREGPEGARERWRALGRASKPLRPGDELLFDGIEAVVEGREDEMVVVTMRAVAAVAGGIERGRVGGAIAPAGEIGAAIERVGEVRAATERTGSVGAAIDRAGEVPLPPYIRRAAGPDDRERYQTVFAERPGAVAAPTAGLHLSRRLLEALGEAGHETARVTLHVGPGTFAPIRVERLQEHAMHAERWAVPAETAAAIGQARAEGRPVVAVGTTVVRTLESAGRDDGTVTAGEGRTSLFIHPPFRFRVVDALLTNFHLPKSSLLALVMAFGGVETVREAYRAAVAARYRFFSYGDAMLLKRRAS